MPAMAPSSRATRWRGPQPVRAQAEPEASRAEKNACETNGLERQAEPAQGPCCASGRAKVSRLSRSGRSRDGLAQASQSAAGISLTDGSDSRVISDDAI